MAAVNELHFPAKANHRPPWASLLCNHYLEGCLQGEFDVTSKITYGLILNTPSFVPQEIGRSSLTTQSYDCLGD